jgi:uncharacterized protein YbcI
MNPINKTAPPLASKKAPSAGAVARKKPPANLSRDKRRSNRRNVQQARQACELKVGANIVSALLVNESKTGFAVLTKRLADLKIGALIQLHTDNGFFTVRVVHVKEVARPRDASPAWRPKFRLGLKKEHGLFSTHSTSAGKWPEKGDPNRYGEELPVKTQRTIELAISEGISRFEQDYMGKEPKDVRVYLLGDLLAVRLQSALAETKQQLTKLRPAEKEQGLLESIRSHLIKATRPVINAMIEKVTGVEVVATHHDINTTTGEDVFIFTLARSPLSH